MALVTGVGTTYNLPNYHGELFTVTPTETPFLSSIGGLTGGKPAKATRFEWQTQDRRASSANNAALEGAAAGTGAERARSNLHNVCEIHQSPIEVSYSKLAATGNFSGINVGAQWDDFVADELAIQTQAELESMAVDIEQSFLNGTLNEPTDNTTARKTQGILGAIATVNANGGVARAVTPALVDATLQAAFGAGAKLPQATTVLMLGQDQLTKVQNAYAAAAAPLLVPPRDPNVAGLQLQQIRTAFGTFGVMLNRWMPTGQIAVVDLSVCYPVFLPIPGKGFLFVEELARTGASRKFQIYGEVGLEYGPTTYHALLKDLS